VSAPYPSSPASTPAFWTLREYLAELWVILVFVDVVYSDMSIKSADVSKVREIFHLQNLEHTFEDCQAGDICALCRDRMGRHSREIDVLVHAVSFRSSA
jgi:hypothetical protein